MLLRSNLKRPSTLLLVVGIIFTGCKMPVERLDLRTGPGGSLGADQKSEDEEKTQTPVEEGSETPTPTPALQKWGFTALGKPMLALAESHSCVIDKSGVKCWGSPLEDRTRVPDLEFPQRIAAGRAHTCALHNTGVDCWGENNWKQVDRPTLETDVKFLAAGAVMSCAASEKKVTCWGHQIPAGLNEKEFVKISGIAVGNAAVCVIEEKKIKCFGDDTYGLVTTAPAVSDVEQISLFYHHACAVYQSQVVCWGMGDDGQASAPALTNVTMVATGQAHSCALHGTTVSCWGKTSGSLLTPPVLDEPTAVNAGASHSCALDAKGVQCWGSDQDGQAKPLSSLEF